MSFYSDRVFPRLLALIAGQFDQDRAWLLRHARGRVLELGIGTGASLGFYGPDISELVAIDPHGPVLERARENAGRFGNRSGSARLPFPVALQRADAQALPFDDASFDTVVAFLTLCSVTDPAAAAREAARVLRPDGRLLVLEHVYARPDSRLARWQDRLDPAWSRAAAGCHLNRDTAAVLDRAGFDTGPLERYREPSMFRLTAPRVRGILRRRGAEADGGARTARVSIL